MPHPISLGFAPMNVAGLRRLVVDEPPEVYLGKVAYEDHAGVMLERGGCLRAPPLLCIRRRFVKAQVQTLYTKLLPTRATPQGKPISNAM